jgi:predicted Rossmann fold nucleotide-binding protein DprA/Smf involved in DNA uptake
LSEAIALLRIPGIGPSRYRKLTEAFKSPGQVLAAPISQLEAVPGFSRKIASDIHEHCDTEAARKVAADVVQKGWSVLFIEDDDYPAMLREIERQRRTLIARRDADPWESGYVPPCWKRAEVLL